MDESTTPRTARGRRGLGPGLTVFVVVDVLLVLAALVALAAFLSSRDDGDPVAVPSPSVTSPAPEPEPTETEPEPTPDEPEETETGTFALPSGNIACDISADAATCTIADSAAEPVTVEGCPGPVGQIVTVTPEGATTPCITGALPGPAAPGTPVLDYGQSTAIGDFTCLSETSGVTCRHEPSGSGFSLARAGVQLF